MDMGMDMAAPPDVASPSPATRNAQSKDPTSYFSYGEHSTTIIAHIALMILAWCFILPTAVMLSSARSRLALPSQFLFLAVNAVGLLIGIIYNTQTPDLYENNAHHKLGWVVTWIFTAQVVLALIFRYAGRGEAKNLPSRDFEHATFLPVAGDEEERLYQDRETQEYRWPDESTQAASSSSDAEYNDFDKPDQSHPESSPPRHWYHSRVIARLLSTRVLRISNLTSNIIDRLILPLGFTTIATGAITYGGIFHGKQVFNGAAHFIKGGIFFWYGILTLGRFMGAWADLGWAWNKKPPPASVVGGRWKARIPSAEFVESFVIFTYGVTNVFLEHLAGWGKAWTPRDLQHVSISVMFFGGGLAGMLIESARIREALNRTLLPPPSSPESHPRNKTEAETENEKWTPPPSQHVPLNPMPALVILLLGMMMGSHHQDRMTSTMVHKQWGNMLVGFALARGLTYILLFMRPPTSYLPSRPPTEIVAAFCLVSGGLIFMLSARDVILAMEAYELDPMFTFTVGMGVTAFIMSLVVLGIALRAWAVRRERTTD
ncbi:hypothetical protein BJX64DRAFT_273631 [Aspergillus heterothallicus]